MPSAHASAPSKTGFRWLGGFILAHRRDALGALLCGFIAGAATAAQPYLIGLIIDDIRRGAPSGKIAQDILILFALAALILVAFFGQRYFAGQVAYNVNYDLRQAVFSNMLRLDQGFYQRHATGDLISRAHSDMEMIWRLLAIGFTRFGSALFTLIGAFVLLGAVNLPLTMVTFVVLGISTSIQLRVGRALAPVWEYVQEQAGQLSALVQDSITGIQTLKTFGREGGVARRYAEENAEYRRRWLFFKRRNEPVGMLPNMISETTAGIVVLFGGILTLNGDLTLGNFAQFLLYLGYITNVLLQLGTIFQRWQQTRGALARIAPLTDAARVADAPDAVTLPAPRGAVTFENVSVAIDGKTLLHNINLEIAAGQTVAFVGPTGSGKTLLLSLLARVLDPTAGRVLLDGVDVRQVRLDDLRRAIAYVPQATFLFSQPLQRNVRMAQLELEEAALMEAVEISRLSNDLPQLPHGLETLVGERGVMLSGGQKQRVAIARAIVHEPAVLILDDALSSVDTHTAAQILDALHEVLRVRTSLIIAHRMATVREADHIVVMDGGQIAEQGKHEALMARGGLYARMAARELIHKDRQPMQEGAQ